MPEKQYKITQSRKYVKVNLYIINYLDIYS